MKYIITETQYRVIRRREEMKKLIDDSLTLIGEQNGFDRRGWDIPLSNLILIIAEYVSNNMASSSNLGGDEFITFRNQIKLYIRNNFYEYIKEFLESRQ